MLFEILSLVISRLRNSIKQCVRKAWVDFPMCSGFLINASELGGTVASV